jgi:hypothetical protein
MGAEITGVMEETSAFLFPNRLFGINITGKLIQHTKYFKIKIT